MKYSFNTWAFSSYPNWLPAYPLRVVIERLANIGYDGIELGCTAPHAWPYFLDAQQRKDIRQCAEDNHILFSTLLPVTGAGPGNNPASADIKEREWTVKHLCDVCDLAEELNCNKVLYVAGFFIYGSVKKDAWKYSLESLTKAAEYAKKKNISIVIEPTASDSNLVESIDDALLLKEQCGLDNIEIMFDTQHAFFRAEQPADYVYRLGKELSHLHFADFNRQAPGDSGFDFQEIMQALKDIGYAGYITMEAGFTQRAMQPFTVARRALEYLKKIESNLK